MAASVNRQHLHLEISCLDLPHSLVRPRYAYVQFAATLMSRQTRNLLSLEALITNLGQDGPINKRHTEQYIQSQQ